MYYNQCARGEGRAELAAGRAPLQKFAHGHRSPIQQPSLHALDERPPRRSRLRLVHLADCFDGRLSLHATHQFAWNRMANGGIQTRSFLRFTDELLLRVRRDEVGHGYTLASTSRRSKTTRVRRVFRAGEAHQGRHMNSCCIQAFLCVHAWLSPKQSRCPRHLGSPQPLLLQASLDVTPRVEHEAIQHRRRNACPRAGGRHSSADLLPERRRSRSSCWHELPSLGPRWPG